MTSLLRGLLGRKNRPPLPGALAEHAGVRRRIDFNRPLEEVDFVVFDTKRIWPYLEGGPELILEQDPLRRLTADGELTAFRHEGFWLPMDTYREFKLLDDLWRSGNAPWKAWS